LDDPRNYSSVDFSPQTLNVLIKKWVILPQQPGEFQNFLEQVKVAREILLA
jgi:hypothetical protein